MVPAHVQARCRSWVGMADGAAAGMGFVSFSELVADLRDFG